MVFIGFLVFCFVFIYVYFALYLSEQRSGLIAKGIQAERQLLRSPGLIPK